MARRRLRLSIPLIRGGADPVIESNLDDCDMTLIMLASKGYDTITNLKQMDTIDILNLVEFETIKASVEQQAIKEAQDGNR